MRMGSTIQLECLPVSQEERGQGLRVLFAGKSPVDSWSTQRTETDVNLGEGSVCFCQD